MNKSKTFVIEAPLLPHSTLGLAGPGGDSRIPKEELPGLPDGLKYK